MLSALYLLSIANIRSSITWGRFCGRYGRSSRFGNYDKFDGPVGYYSRVSRTENMHSVGMSLSNEILFGAGEPAADWHSI